MMLVFFFSFSLQTTPATYVYIFSLFEEVVGFENTPPGEAKLFDHRPLKLNQDDFERVQKIPKKKVCKHKSSWTILLSVFFFVSEFIHFLSFQGANFRDLAGVKIGGDNVVFLDPDVKRPLVSSGKPLVPDYAISFIKGKSLKYVDHIITISSLLLSRDV